MYFSLSVCSTYRPPARGAAAGGKGAGSERVRGRNGVRAAGPGGSGRSRGRYLLQADDLCLLEHLHRVVLVRRRVAHQNHATKGSSPQGTLDLQIRQRHRDQGPKPVRTCGAARVAVRVVMPCTRRPALQWRAGGGGGGPASWVWRCQRMPFERDAHAARTRPASTHVSVSCASSLLDPLCSSRRMWDLIVAISLRAAPRSHGRRRRAWSTRRRLASLARSHRHVLRTWRRPRRDRHAAIPRVRARMC